jgi:hypothetical protein
VGRTDQEGGKWKVEREERINKIKIQGNRGEEGRREGEKKNMETGQRTCMRDIQYVEKM